MSKTAIDPRNLEQSPAELPSADDDDSVFDTAGARSEAFAEDLYDEPAGTAEPVRRRSASLRPWWVAAGAAVVGVSAVTASLVAAAFSLPI